MQLEQQAQTSEMKRSSSQCVWTLQVNKWPCVLCVCFVEGLLSYIYYFEISTYGWLIYDVKAYAS